MLFWLSLRVRQLKHTLKVTKKMKCATSITNFQSEHEHPLLYGLPLMVSDYVSFELALGIKPTADQLVEINRLRVAGPGYYSEKSADGKFVMKFPLQYYPEVDSITVHVIQPGENKDGLFYSCTQPSTLAFSHPLLHSVTHSCLNSVTQSPTTLIQTGWWSIHKILHQAEDAVIVLRVVVSPIIYQYIPVSYTHLTLPTNSLV